MDPYHLPAIRVTSPHSDPIFITDTVPPSLAAYVLPCAEKKIAASGAFGYFLQQQFDVASLYQVWYNNLFPEQDETFHFTASGPLLVLQFFLRNSISFAGEGMAGVFHEGRYNLFYLPVVDHEAAVRKHRIYSTLCIAYPHTELERMAKTYPAMKTFLEKVELQIPASLFPVHPVIPLTMRGKLDSLLRCNYRPEVKDDILQNELVGIFFEVMEQTYEDHKGAEVTIEQADQLYTVQMKVENNLDAPISLKKLSRQVGMSQRKLNDLFKALFGISITDYHIRARMHKAKDLLARNNTTIGAIAEAVGYTSGKTFSKEFEKHHGVTPSEYRKAIAGKYPDS